MDTRERTPRWWGIYAWFLLLVGLLWLEGHAALAPLGRQVAQVGMVLAFLVLSFAWLRAENTALTRRWLNNAARQHYTYQVVRPGETLSPDGRRQQTVGPKIVVLAAPDEKATLDMQRSLADLARVHEPEAHPMSTAALPR